MNYTDRHDYRLERPIRLFPIISYSLTVFNMPFMEKSLIDRRSITTALPTRIQSPTSGAGTPFIAVGEYPIGFGDLL